MLPLISVIIPVYNHARALKASLRFLGAQTYNNLQTIIVNDGSTDNIGDLVSEFKINRDVTCVIQPNLGASAARNRGFTLAAGEYVIFWDADTVAPKNFLRALFQALQDSPVASYAYCSYRLGLKSMRAREFSGPALRQRNYIDTTSLIRRSAVADLGAPFDASLKRFQDWDLWLTLLSKNRIGVFVPAVKFKKIFLGRRLGISRWLPRAAYLWPWPGQSTASYFKAKQIVELKHGLKTGP